MSSQKDTVIIGLEIHIQLTNLKTKLFCSCNNNYRGAEPNSCVVICSIGLSVVNLEYTL